MRLRRLLYRTSSVLGDLHAVERGRIPQRLVRKIVYRHAFRLAGTLCRLLKVSK